jgi:hypothetical protein
MSGSLSEEWSAEALQNIKFQSPNLRVSVFSVQVSASMAIFPDTRHLKPPQRLAIFNGKAIQL